MSWTRSSTEPLPDASTMLSNQLLELDVHALRGVFRGLYENL
jgi:hypothetical protein